ncbi:MAG TPA: permease-like cell division protein FtsX [Pseudolysinimonas sp.]|jgi:cell division transport system permease protein|nr:permease-like cell division protein FtsX [Pseudolysinimonas sp.]
MRFGLILSEVGQGFRRNLSMVVSVVLVTFISLTFFGAAILLQTQISQTKGYWYDRAQVAVYLCSDYDSEAPCNETAATDAQKADVKAELEGDTLGPYIKKVEFESRDQAYANFLVQFEGTTAVQLVTPDILNESYRINLKNPDQAEIIIDQLTDRPGVQSVTDQRGLLEPIFAIMNAATFTAVSIAGLMLIAAVLLIATTIRLSAFSRRRELGIMRLVGASNRFIETPFILEGVLAALIGSLLAGGLIVVLVQFFVQGYLAQALQGTALVNLKDALLVVPVLLLSGALLAAVSASVAIRRYLKV